MSFLFLRYPNLYRQFRRSLQSAGRNAFKIAGLLTAAALISCGHTEPAPTETGGVNTLVLEDLPGKTVTETGQAPAPQEIQKEELEFRSNHWSEVTPEMRAYLNIHRGDESTKPAVVPGAGDTAATPVQLSADRAGSPAENTAGKPESAQIQKDPVKEKVKSPGTTGHKKAAAPAKAAGEDSGTAPSEDDNSPVELSDPLMVKKPGLHSGTKHAANTSGPDNTSLAERDPVLRNAIDDANRRAMLASGVPSGSSADSTNPAPAGLDEAAKSTASAQTEGAAAKKSFSFRAMFAVLALALSAIVLTKTLRRAKKK